jgi:alginate O-acetyltransferase complex protein AlgI
MVFSEYAFLFLFLPVCLSCLLITRASARRWTLLGFSYLFYGWVRYDFCLIMAASTLLDYGVARAMEGRVDRVRRRLLTLSIVGNVGLLAWFKYRFFAATAFDGLANHIGLPPLALQGSLILPAGISFYTFQSLSYTVDVYRRTITPEKNLATFATYISLFPQLVAGPIVRFAEVRESLMKLRAGLSDWALGAQRFMIGLAKKVLIANQVAPCADALFGGAGDGALDAWVGVFAFGVQIAFDFSGYSDMAIGLGRMLGLTFPENFRSPYQATSVTDFWRRWHMTLGAWFRDYLYIPLGGNRAGRARTTINLVVTMLLCGLWHGANWTFLIWGAWHGLLLLLERVGLLPNQNRWRIVGQPFTLLLVMLGWVWFASASVSVAMPIFEKLFFAEGIGEWTLLWPHHGTLGLTAIGVGLGFALFAPPSQRFAAALSPKRAVVSFIMFLLAVLFLLFEGEQIFLYFQF